VTLVFLSCYFVVFFWFPVFQMKKEQGRNALFAVLLTVVLYVAFIPESRAISSGNMTIMTYNLGCVICNTTTFPFSERVHDIKTIFDLYNPVIVGTQSLVFPHEVKELQGILPNHSAIYFKTDELGQVDTGATIFYRNDMFQLVTSDVFWLSPTPDAPFSEGFAPFRQTIPRLWIWAQFSIISTGQNFIFSTTHFDPHHPCQEKSAILALNRTQPLANSYPIIATGEFNSDSASKAYHTLTSGIQPNSFHFNDTYPMAHIVREDTNQYNINFTEAKNTEHVFIAGQGSFTIYEYIENHYVFDYENFSSHMPSDHPAYAIKLSFSS